MFLNESSFSALCIGVFTVHTRYQNYTFELANNRIIFRALNSIEQVEFVLCNLSLLKMFLNGWEARMDGASGHVS